MIFNSSITESTAVTNWDAVTPCKYDANLEGALMLVYENECNYNALMRAAGLSELKYYTETGKDLFVHEAGAFAGFLEKAKSFFKAAWEKIKSLFKKFFMQINAWVAKDKDFVKKYESTILRATNLTDFEFKGWKFNDSALDDPTTTIKGFNSTFLKAIDDIEKISNVNNWNHADTAVSGGDQYDTEDKINDAIETHRGELVGKGKIDEEEYREQLNEYLYGDSSKEKDVLEEKDINLRNQISIIKETKKNVKAIEKVEQKISKFYDELIKALDKKIKEFAKRDDASQADSEAVGKSKDAAIKVLNARIRIAKSLSNDYTIACGAICTALQERNRQAKAICIKAVSYSQKKQNESAVSESGYDLFASVNMK